MSDLEMLSEPWTFQFPYARTTGPTVGRFLKGLQDRRIFGLRTADGGVLVPPHAHDPWTSETLEEWVEVGTEGAVTSWTWIDHPLPQHPFERPFAFALVQLDGASTGFFHVVDAGDVETMATGMRVKVRWADELRGHITDIACFEPVSVDQGARAEPVVVQPERPADAEHWRFEFRFSSDYTILAGKAYSVFLRGLAEKKLIGMRGPSGDVLIPPDGADPVSGLAVTEAVELPHVGTVVRFCVVNVPVRDQVVTLPFVAADVLLDGADSTFMTVIQGLPQGQVRLGLRVRAVWVEDDQLEMSLSNIKWFEPTGEPDADLSSLEDYL